MSDAHSQQMVFEAMKQQQCRKYISEFAYSKVSHGLLKKTVMEEIKETKEKCL
jgi:hypothetical protein